MDSKKAALCAKYEVGWWKDHGRDSYEGVLENMQNLYVIQYGLTPEQAKNVVEFRIKAAKEHDVAEELERNGKMEEAKAHWESAEELLVKHFELL
jgi:hypothetical protein